MNGVLTCGGGWREADNPPPPPPLLGVKAKRSWRKIESIFGSQPRLRIWNAGGELTVLGGSVGRTTTSFGSSPPWTWHVVYTLHLPGVCTTYLRDWERRRCVRRHQFVTHELYERGSESDAPRLLGRVLVSPLHFEFLTLWFFFYTFYRVAAFISNIVKFPENFSPLLFTFFFFKY